MRGARHVTRLNVGYAVIGHYPFFRRNALRCIRESCFGVPLRISRFKKLGIFVVGGFCKFHAPSWGYSYGLR